MPNWKYPCIECTNPVKSNQRGLLCNTCNMWVHLKCTNLTKMQYDFLELNEDIPFFCLKCSSNPTYAVQMPEDAILNNSSSSLNSSIYFSPAHDSDFETECDDESVTDSRGLNFDSLPTHKAQHSSSKALDMIASSSKRIPCHTRNFKFPCVVCFGPCRENCQDSICCTLCDEWTHKKCSHLTTSEFNKYCLPENSDMPFYCDICLYGSRQNRENQTCLKASEISSLDTNDIFNLCPNSIFSDKDDIPTTEYFTSDELNVVIKKNT